MPNEAFSIHRVVRFAIFAGIHALLFHAATSLPEPLGQCILLVSLLPWLPLAWLGLPVMVAPAFPMPNVAGELWCVAVWAVFYWWLAGIAGRRAGHARSGAVIAR